MSSSALKLIEEVETKPGETSGLNEESLLREVLRLEGAKPREIYTFIDAIINSEPDILRNLIDLIKKYSGYRKKRMLRIPQAEAIEAVLVRDVAKKIIVPAILRFVKEYGVELDKETAREIGKSLLEYYKNVLSSVKALLKHMIKYKSLWNMALGRNTVDELLKRVEEEKKA